MGFDAQIDSSVHDRDQIEGYSFSVTANSVGQRLDQFLASQPNLSDVSRSKIKSLLDQGFVLVNHFPKKASYRVQLIDEVEIFIPPPKASELVAEEVDFEILFEDDSLVVLVKPPGLVVHPACGHLTGTLVHGLLHRCENLSGINGEQRPGIVHRLDKDTSGVMVVAKNDPAHQGLVEQFQNREIGKIYQAILDGRPALADGRIALPIGRHPVNRKKMAVSVLKGREAGTTWRVMEELPANFSLVELKLETGRTHQIRVHMAHLGSPVAGDVVYGKKNKMYAELGIARQCLHAYFLTFRHPITGLRLEFTAPLWPDMVNTLDHLRRLQFMPPGRR